MDKSVSGSYGIQHHMPKDPGGVLPTSASGNGHIDPGPGYIPSHSLGAHGGHCLRQSHTNERAFVEVQVFSRKVSAHCWSKKYQFGCTGESKRNRLYTYVPSPPRQNSSGQGKTFLAHDFSHRGSESKHMSECSASPAMQEAAKGAHFSLTPPRVLSHELYDCKVGRN